MDQNINKCGCWRNGCLSSATCDPKDDSVEVVLEGRDDSPGLVTYRWDRHIVKFRESVMLSAPSRKISKADDQPTLESADDYE